MAGTSPERTKTIHWLHFVDAINKCHREQKESHSPFLKNALTSSQSREGKVESQTKLTS